MPMLTTSVMALPVQPFHSPERIELVNSFICCRTLFTAGITSSPSTMIARLERLRSATCSTGLSLRWWRPVK
jgi:hypothetical protein